MVKMYSFHFLNDGKELYKGACSDPRRLEYLTVCTEREEGRYSAEAEIRAKTVRIFP
jgi:hypothetical protein